MFAARPVIRLLLLSGLGRLVANFGQRLRQHRLHRSGRRIQSFKAQPTVVCIGVADLFVAIPSAMNVF